ncbi:hypothetical protein [Antarctic microvirus TYR_006_V_25]|nr:hypothetical protein [Antarctic microvirus TYR_006_V_25]
MRNNIKKTKLNSVNKQKITIFVSQKQKQMIQNNNINHKKLIRAKQLVTQVYKQIIQLQLKGLPTNNTLLTKLNNALRLETHYQKYSLIPKY